MSCIVYQTDKKSGVKYAYESISYWDKEKKQPRSKRKYLGRVDPETGEIISSRRKKTLGADNGQDYATLYEPVLAQLREELLEKESQIELLQKELHALTSKYKKAEKLLTKITSLTVAFAEENHV